uniref:NADH dehydrogenase n=1 Tax=Candidatus Kentrum sp. DK TaxID=2126562 RepID=A0A450SKB9_9GAMM|nr:MAG: NADH dehydrogenase [Candidatus Kentron sp. DK]
MKVAIIGGTGYVGSYLVDALLSHGHHPILLVRPGSSRKVGQADRCTLVSGDVKNEDTVRELVAQAEAVIYNVGILREFPQRDITFKDLQYKGACHAMHAALDSGVERFLLTSANGARMYGTAYQHTKYLAEKCLLASKLAGTVFRPSVIFGPPPNGCSEFATRLVHEMIKPIIPAPLFFDGFVPFGAGSFPLAPIHARDVAEIYVRALEDSATVKQTYSLCGPDRLAWRDIIRTIAQAVGRDKWMVPTSVALLKVVAAAFEDRDRFPITRDQLTMLMEGNVCDSSEVFEKFGITPMRFNEQNLSYLHERA